MQLMDPKTIALAFVVTGAVSLYIYAAELEKVVMQALSHSVAAQRFATLYFQVRSGLRERFPLICTPAAARETATVSTGTMEVVRVPALNDNYVWILHEPQNGLTAVVDPAEVPPVNAALQQRGWTLNYILNTHHHFDHTGGNLELKKQYKGLQIVGPRADASRIPGIDIQLGDGDTWRFGNLQARVFDTPGHTRGHITFWFPEAKALFPGDTLFALGCGRLFEGHPEMMWTSLSKLLPLPRDTLVYCAHEYTQSNARFAVHIDPSNTVLAARKQAIDDARSKGEATVPSLFGEELDTNPFLRPSDSGIRASVKADSSIPDHEVFGRVRAAKDGFRG
jgi:hydroxyacylglutathione hydrolase